MHLTFDCLPNRKLKNLTANYQGHAIIKMLAQSIDCIVIEYHILTE
jgi:hypothetical protein